MSSIVSQVCNSAEYWKGVVIVDFDEFMAEPDSIRRAFHCAISLSHMCDWVYHSHAQNVELTYPLVGNAKPSEKTIKFADELQSSCIEFGLMRGISNAAKHLKLRNRGTHIAAPSDAANVATRTTGYGEGGYGQGPYGGSPRVMLAGPQGNDLEFIDLAETVRQMWLDLSARHGWSIQ